MFIVLQVKLIVFLVKTFIFTVVTVKINNLVTLKEP
jgi:hypothetical protein